MNELTAHIVKVARQWLGALARGQPEVAMDLLDPSASDVERPSLRQMLHALYCYGEDDANWDLVKPPADWIAQLRTPGGIVTPLEEMPPVPGHWPDEGFYLPEEGDDEDVWVTCVVPIRGEWGECLAEFIGGYREDGTPCVTLYSISR